MELIVVSVLFLIRFNRDLGSFDVAFFLFVIRFSLFLSVI